MAGQPVHATRAGFVPVSKGSVLLPAPAGAEGYTVRRPRARPVGAGLGGDSDCALGGRGRAPPSPRSTPPQVSATLPSRFQMPAPPADTLCYGDCLDWMGRWDDATVDLIYLDPPFNSNANYNVLYARDSAGGAQTRAFVDTWTWDAASGERLARYEAAAARPAHRAIVGLARILGPSGMLAYLTYMAERIEQMHRLLKPSGTLYLHCDPTANGYLRVLLDAIFGPDTFRNEIVWQRSHPKGHAFTRFASNHDVVLAYGNRSVEPETGRRYQLTSLLNPNRNRPNLTYEFKGVRRVWRWTRERMEEADRAGLIVVPRGGQGVPSSPSGGGSVSPPLAPASVASAAPRDGPRSSRHVFADGARVAAGRDRLLGNLPRVPRLGHLRAPLLPLAVGGLPSRVPRLRVERAGLAPRRARRVARVGGRRRIDKVANGGRVQDVGAAIEVDQVRQGHRRVRDDQRHVLVRAQAQHLVPPVAGGEPEGPCPGRIGPVLAPAQGPPARRQTARAPRHHISIGQSSRLDGPAPLFYRPSTVGHSSYQPRNTLHRKYHHASDI